MSKRKLLIQEVFEQGKKECGKTSKSGIALYLKVHLEEAFRLIVDERTLVRYYDAFIAEIRKEINLDYDSLNKMSQYLGYKDFADFSRTFIKKDEDANKTTVKISVDKDEESLTEKLSNIIINITNEQHFKMPEFIKQNGLGIMEIVLLVCLVTGNVVFSSNKKVNMESYGFMAKENMDIDKKYMYWNGERYIATDSSYIGPRYGIVAMDEHKFLYFQKNMRKDTLNEVNALGRTWYSKHNNVVEFFTEDGVDPENGRELRKSTPLILYKYAGKPKDTLQIEE